MPYLPFDTDMPYLYLLQAGFTIWMLIDCLRRGAEVYWFWIILVVPGIGAWVYFFAVKVRDFRRFEGLAIWPFHSRPSLEELRYRVQQSPTQAHHLALAERLMEQGDHLAAIPHLEAVLAREPDYCPALFALAECHMGTQQPHHAVPLLEKVLDRDCRWGNYRAWYLLLQAHAGAGNVEAALGSCRELVRQAPTLQHKCLLAEQLCQQGQTAEAQQLLTKAIEDYQYAPGSIRRRDRRWASEARRLHKQICSPK